MEWVKYEKTHRGVSRITLLSSYIPFRFTFYNGANAGDDNGDKIIQILMNEW